MRDFLLEFKKICQAIDKPESSKQKDDNIRTMFLSKRFNVHKRSLPVGIDKIVIFNVSKTDAEWWVEHVLKSKIYENSTDDSKTLVYYDVIPVGATPKERSVYFNGRPTTI